VIYAVNHFAPGFWFDFFREVNAAYAVEPFQVTSWYRSPSHNRRVGGDPDSQHLVGAALDVVTEKPGKLAAEFARFGWQAVNEGDHLHLQAWPAGIARRVGLLDALGL